MGGGGRTDSCREELWGKGFRGQGRVAVAKINKGRKEV